MVFIVANIEILGLRAIFEMIIFKLEVILLNISIDFTRVNLLLYEHFAVKNIDDEVDSYTDESWLTWRYINTEIELLRLLWGKAEWKRTSFIVSSNFFTINKDLVDAYFELLWRIC